MIAHVDIDAFYASVAIADNPALAGLPLVIAGRSRHAVVLTASYEARKFGLRSAMPLFQALELCPHVTVVEPVRERYRELSGRVFALIEALGRPFESLALDEAYIDFSEAGDGDVVGGIAELRRQVRTQTGLTVSAGIAASKLVAKIASDSAKPDGVKIVRPGEEAAFLAPLPVGRLYGVGPKTEKRCRGLGLETIGALAGASDDLLREIFGRSGGEFRDRARGIDPRTVTPERERKSFSSETTFEHATTSEREILAVFYEQAHELGALLAQRGFRAAGVGIKVKRPDFQIAGRQTTLREPTADPRIIFAAARYCFRHGGFSGNPLRLAGLRVSALSTNAVKQLPLF